jgi:SprT-like family
MKKGLMIRPFFCMKEAHIQDLLKGHIPLSSVEYAVQLWTQTPFELKVTRSRHTKVGDFAGCNTSARHRITINRDLNPYLFLLTYVHEVAHLRVHLYYKSRTNPHGEQWKTVFQHLMAPVLREDVFPPLILHRLLIHMSRPKASSFADRELTVALRKYDSNAMLHTMVGDLPEGSVFKLQGKFFRKGKLKRTRILCSEIKSRRQYLVPAEALVSEVQLSLL